MRVHIATDHAAFELKEYLVERLNDAGHEVVDHGAATYEALDDYPPLIIPCAEAVAAEGGIGIVLGGSGNGEQIAANKVKGIRCAMVSEPYSAMMCRRHNDANMISIGARVLGEAPAKMIVRAFLTESFEGGRHQRRVDLITDIENNQ